MMVLSEQAKVALERAKRAYKATETVTSTRSVNKAQTHFLAATEVLFHVILADQNSK